MKIKSLLIVGLIVLSLSLSQRSDKAQAASTCGGFVAPSMSISWLPFGVVGLPYTNLFHLPTRFSDFTVIWTALEARAAGPGVISLARVTVGGTGPADPATTVIWQGPDFVASTGGHTDGTWLTDYIFQPGDSETIYLDFDGTTTTLQAAFGAQSSDFNGTNFVIDPICPQGAGSSSSEVPGFISDGRLNPAWGDHFAVIYPTDGVGNPALRIYRVGDNSVGWLALAVNVEDIPAVSDENILIASDNSVAVYLLTSGEIQITLGPDETGKFYTVIIDQLPVTVMRYSA